MAMDKQSIKELTVFLNKYGYDNLTNTPDYILANYLLNQIDMLYDLNRGRDNASRV